MAFTHYSMFTVDRTKCGSADTNNYPVGIIGTFPRLRTVANGGRVQNASGFDIRPYVDANILVPLDFELVSYNPATGFIEMWLRLPTLSVSINSSFALAYGNAGITTDGTSTAVWDANYTGVYHLGNGIAVSTKDSTVNANNGVNSGANAWPGPSEAGTLGGAAGFNGGQRITLGASASLSLPGDATLEAWCKPNVTTGPKFLMSTSDDAGGLQFAINLGRIAARHGVIWGSTPTGGFDLFNGSAVIDLTWQYFATTRLGPTGAASGTKLYRNGVQDGASFSGTKNPGAFAGAWIGAFTTSNVQGIDGIVDEARFSKVVRTASYLLATYNNMLSPSTFYSVGAEQVAPSGDLWVSPGTITPALTVSRITPALTRAIIHPATTKAVITPALTKAIITPEDT